MTLGLVGSAVEERPRREPFRWRPSWRVDICVCGGALAADPRNDASVQRAVIAHQWSALHVAWRRAGGFARSEAPIDQP